MSDRTQKLAEVQEDLARVRACLRTLPVALDECTRFSFFRSWPQRVSRMADCVSLLTTQMSRLTHNVEVLCDLMKQDEPPAST